MTSFAETDAKLMAALEELDLADGPDLTAVQIKCLKCELTTCFDVEKGIKISETDARCPRCETKFEGETVPLYKQVCTACKIRHVDTDAGFDTCEVCRAG